MNAIQIAETLKSNFIRYLLTTFNVGRNERELADTLRRGFEAPGALFRGPFLELNPPYATECTLRDLANEKVVHPDLCRFREDILPAKDRPLPPDRPLYTHQVKAIRKIIVEGRNVVIASGTGSGKTECFLIPILHDLLSDPAPGVRALLIYPMNALVNDQLLRLRKLLDNTNITFGRYTSELEEKEKDGRRKLSTAPMNEIVSREIARRNPPQILITNYAMLEYLLIRPQDSPLFDSGLWRFVCLDEAHTYTGAQGIEVSMLLRRLKHRLNKQRGEMCCIATSATLTKDHRAAANFVHRLFGEKFNDEDVIFGETLPITVSSDHIDAAPPLEAYFNFPDALRDKLRDCLAQENNKNRQLLQETAEALRSSALVGDERINQAHQSCSDGDIAKFLWYALRSNTHLVQLKTMMREKPIELELAAANLFGTNTASDASTQAICRLVELGALARESSETMPLLPARYHLFARAPQGAWVCVNNLCPGRLHQHTGWSRVYLEKRERCQDCSAAVFELSVCRNCGQGYLRAFKREEVFEVDGLYENDIAGQQYFTWTPLHLEPDLESDEEASEEMQAASLQICLTCRKKKSACTCGQKTVLKELYRITDKKGNPREKLSTCPRCNSMTHGEIVTPLRLGRSGPLAVLTEELYQFTPRSSDPECKNKSGEGRKLITFADSRQGAARYAAYLQSTVNGTLYRHLIVRAAQELASKLSSLEELAVRSVELGEQYGLFGEDTTHATPSQRRDWMKEARARITAEFCARTDPRHAVWALGLVGCDVFFASNLKTPTSLCSSFGLSPEEMLIVTQSLLDTMRLDKAVTMPEGVKPDHEAFGRNKAAIHYRLTGANSKEYERNWAGSTTGKVRQLARFDYVQRIFQKTGKPSESLVVQNALKQVWDWLIDQKVFVGEQNGRYQIDVTRLVFPTLTIWYRCDRCSKLSRRRISEKLNICPSRGCEGQLEPCDPESLFADNHYHYLFSRLPIGMRVEEHTAQLQPELGQSYQNQFIQGDINVLSCSTTFELGVDVGELQTVVLNNVPPTISNYRQRAGRAGRRAGGTAFILTYAATRPHDRFYFSDPARIIAGEVAVPYLALENHIISARHLNAILLGHFLRHLRDLDRAELLKSGPFFSPNLPNGRHVDFLSQWQNETAQKISPMLQRFFTENVEADHETTAASINRFVDGLSKCREYFEHWLAEYIRLRDHYTAIADTANNTTQQQAAERMRKRFNSLRQRLLDEDLIDFLCREGILPSYSFPIDVVELRLPRDRQYRGDRFVDTSLRLERDKKIAIVEYAPGAEVVADQYIWKSVGVVIRQELNSFEYRVCQTCRHLDRSERGGLPISGACGVCGSQIGRSNRYIDPDDFTTDLTAPLRKAGTQVDTVANRSRSFLLPGGQSIKEQTITRDGHPKLRYDYQRDGQLVALNSGDAKDGFEICETCGIMPPPLKLKKGKKSNFEHDNPYGGKCSGSRNTYHLGHAFHTDTLHLRFESTENITLPPSTDFSFWYSLTYALLEGASLALQIQRRDLDGLVQPFNIGATDNPEANFSQEIALYDNVPGGAGHVRRIAEHLELVLRHALIVAQCPECHEDTSCPNCLRNYNNQVYWNDLQRGPVARFLEAFLAETYPENLDAIARGAAQVAAVDKTRWLAREIIASEQELILVVDGVSRQQPKGEIRNWIEILQDLLSRKRHVTLIVSELPPPDRTQMEQLALRNHLHLLVQNYGLKLYLRQPQSTSDWHGIIDPDSERCRAIKLHGERFILNDSTSSKGIITTINREAVQTIKLSLTSLPSRIIPAEELTPPPNVVIKHIKSGESITERALFGELFHNPLKALSINDRFLLSKHHEERLKAYFELVKTPKGQRTKITVATLKAEVTKHNPPDFQTTAEQQQMFKRLARAFPHLEITANIESHLPHDRFLLLTREDGKQARIGIGVGLDFIRRSGDARETDIIIEDPFVG